MAGSCLRGTSKGRITHQTDIIGPGEMLRRSRHGLSIIEAYTFGMNWV